MIPMPTYKHLRLTFRSSQGVEAVVEIDTALIIASDMSFTRLIEREAAKILLSPSCADQEWHLKNFEVLETQ